MRYGRLVLRVCAVLIVLARWLGPLPAAAEEQVVKIGGVLPITGVFAAAGKEVSDGLMDCLAVANQEGGINGKKIVFITEDSQYKLDVGKAAFETIMQRDNPIAMFGDSTHLSKAMADAIRDRYRVLYSSASFSSDLAQAGLYPSIFIPGPTYSDQMGLILRYISQQKPGAKIALVYSDTEFGRDPIPFARKLVPKMKLDLVGERAESPKPKDLNETVEFFRKANPDYLIVHGFAGACLTELVKKSREAGLGCRFIGTYWEVSKKNLMELGPLAEGILTVNPYALWPMDHIPMVRKIRELNAKNHPEVSYRTTHYMGGFAAGMIFLEIMRHADKAGKLNYDGMVEALRNLKDFETGGLTSPLTCYNNSFPQARIWKANPATREFEPETDWTTFRLKRQIE
ncbi:MAG: ABC transporter substrate-binding protein [Thermodesulfobacteriota bacterium]